MLVEPHQQVVHLKEMFPLDTPDVEWISRLGSQGGWIVLSGDVHISTRNSAERKAWKESRLSVFFMAHGYTNKRDIEQAAILMRVWRDLVDRARKLQPGYGLLVPLQGNTFRSVD